ncbi:hypothetical protein RHGRI_022772 [Rhododendron griersonianum]|uniref:TPX2 C-terminal domain-containing protein n=1 Tax=Rhododendron griersonianum TaxID=479676 RepID=A0AAV6J1B9_9ERIC|nr:hypothetical protein RHGRI_022772 [Rhododendron griersonianum]
MGESACLVQPFSYGSGIASGAKQMKDWRCLKVILWQVLEQKISSQGNPMHALGDSVSFGRFMSESLSWEKWSTFSHKSYVEEAERYAQPGSVAQKKAFFEAHYKSIAAKKAAALLEQANAANNHAQPEFEQQSADNLMEHSNVVHGNDDNSNVEQQKAENGKVKPEVLSSNSAVHQKAPRVPASPAKPAAPIHPGRGNNATPLTRNTATHSTDKLKLTPKATPAREQDGSTTPAARRMDSSRVASSPNNKSKNSKTLLSTPTKASANGVLVNPSAIPSSESKRPRTQLDISTPGSKTSAPKWHILSAVYTVLTSFSIVQEKAETELRKLRQSLCFRAQPLPDFYNERETAKDQIKNVKIPLPHPNSHKLGRGKPSSSPLRGITSPPPETASSKKSCSKNFLKNEKSDHKSVLLAP